MRSLIYENFKTQFQKFIGQGIDSKEIEKYFKKFDIVRNKYPKAFAKAAKSVKIDPNKLNDIDQYGTFVELKRVIDILEKWIDIELPEEKDDNEIIPDETKQIYEDGDIIAYRSLSPDGCIEIRKEHGEKANWCVSQTFGNLYFSNRKKSFKPTFYFIKNKKKPTSDPFHFFALMVTENGNFIITSFNNDGDYPILWEDLVKIEPNIIKIKDELISVPLTKYEELLLKQDRKIDFRDMTYNQKKNHILNNGRVGYYRDIPKSLRQLYLKYTLIDMLNDNPKGIKFFDWEFNMLTPKLKKLAIERGFRIEDEAIKGLSPELLKIYIEKKNGVPNEVVKKLSPELLKLYVETGHWLSKDVIQSLSPELLKIYIEKGIRLIPDDVIRKLSPELLRSYIIQGFTIPDDMIRELSPELLKRYIKKGSNRDNLVPLLRQKEQQNKLSESIKQEIQRIKILMS